MLLTLPCYGQTTNSGTPNVEYSGGHEAMDLTVKLFSTASVSRLELTGTGASLRLCAMCPAQPLSSRVRITEAEGERVSVDGRPVMRVFVHGDVKASTGDGRLAQVAGRWSVSAAKDGLHVLVQVPSERYVMAVLQAEAAADEPLESLKALAVVARSFAMQNPQRHGTEGLCDSTHCQALRFLAVSQRVREAVEATAGETLWFRAASSAHQVSGYFTEDCGGMTEDAATLWGGKGKPWLVAHADPYCVRRPALWHAELSVAQVRNALAAEGIAVPEVIRSIAVSKLDRSGRAAVLEVQGTGPGRLSSGAKAPLVSVSQMDGLKPVPFKAALRRSMQTHEVQAGTLRFALNRAYGWNQLRSDWYRVNVVNGRVVFDGRGYGHGVGLCQAGARALAEQGKSYREILGFYFAGTTVRVLKNDAGSASRQGNGWTLHAVSEGNEWIAAGNAAWVRARALLPEAESTAPVVTVYPTTELFREATGEPGWELAATRGSHIAVQPQTVVARASCRHVAESSARSDTGWCGVNDTLLHEFLHVLVEGEAGEKTALWLREGLVEVLAEPRCTAVTLESAYDIDHGLIAAGSWAESQRAHAAACVRVRGLVDRFGFPAVRGWLRSGVPAAVSLSSRQ